MRASTSLGVLTSAGLAAATLTVSASWAARTPSPRAASSAPGLSERPPEARVVAAPSVVRPPPRPAHTRWIAVGGGGDPEMNQISLEEDLLALGAALPEGGLLFFAGGPGTRAVQVESEAERLDDLRGALGALFSPRAGRDARYVETRLAPHGPSTRDALLEGLASALDEPGGSLLFWVSGHGDRGEVPRDSVALLWAGASLAPSDVEAAIDAAAHPRPLRLVVTTCYAGGFAELALAEGEGPIRASDRAVCGVFATRWDEESSGCDPSPDRARDSSYAAHLVDALAGRDRRGGDARDAIDLDHDGRIGLLEAHAFARANALSFDLPTTTSTRLLRALAGDDVPTDEAARRALPEEELVERAIGARLGLVDDADARARLAAIGARRTELEAAWDARQESSDVAWWAARGSLLSRWPVLDDPFHPDFEPMLAAEGAAIEAALDASEPYAAWLEAQDDLGAMDQTLAALRVEAAPLERWLEARETMRLAARLEALGGEPLARYEAMRRCELEAP